MDAQHRAVVQQALEALELHCSFATRDKPNTMDIGIEAITALRQLLEQPEPEAWMRPNKWTLLLVGDNHGLVGKFGCRFVGHPEHYERVDVYAAAPQPTGDSLSPTEMVRPQNCGTGYCSCIECHFKKGGA
jgi:hypothetical protein